MSVSVILPTYNERENIIPLIRSIGHILSATGVEYQIVVVDDNSPDGTAEVISQRCSAWETVNLIQRNGARGLATAVKLGIQESRGDIVVLMDADFSHNPQDLPALLREVGEYDLVNGSRYLNSGGFRGNTEARIFSNVINWFLRFILRLKTTDNTNGFLAVKRSLLNRCDLDRIFYGYGDFHFRLMHQAFLCSAAIREVPVVYRPRSKGRAKTRFIWDGWGYVWSALKIYLGIELMSPSNAATRGGHD
jgi:dolichol-phosphate mannosyltransferase